MPKITYVQPNGEQKTIDVPVGTTIMEGAIDNDIDGIVAACGGSCSCSTCHVHVVDPWLDVTGGPHSAEQDTLSFALAVDGSSRLSCQLEVTEAMDGLVVRVAEEQA